MKNGYLILTLVFGLLFNACTTKKQYTKDADSLITATHYLGEKPPGLVPEVFAPGIVRNASNVSLYPFVSLIDRRVYFTALDSIFSDERIWYVNRLEDSWSDAVQLDSPINDDLGFYINQAKNGDLFYTNISKRRMYQALNENGAFPEVEEVDIEFGHHGFIAPSQEYLLVYDRTKENEERNDFDVYVCFKETDGTWTKPISFGDEVNTDSNEACPSITPDGKYFFFSRSNDEDDSSNWYWVSTEIIEKFRPE